MNSMRRLLNEGRSAHLFGPGLMVLGLMVLAVFVAGCQQQTDDPTAPTTNDTTAAATTEPSPVATDETVTILGRELPSVSECAPGETNGLPDGLWFGFIADADSSGVEFDLACWFVGDPAVVAAAEDGEEEPPNDFYIRNQNDLVRTIPLASNAEIEWLPNPGDPQTATMATVDEWLAGRTERQTTLGVWLTVESGEVTSIVEQYVP